MLDEPTNHLDMQSVEMLIEALNKYEGTLILVSHDRYFISRTTNKVWHIEEGKIKEFVGTYEEWVVFQDEKLKPGTGSLGAQTCSRACEKRGEKAGRKNLSR